VQVAAIVLPLHEPVRVAEDAAVADLCCGGRLELVVVPGYRPMEFELFGKDFQLRGHALETGIDVLRRAWRGEPVDPLRTTRITPSPVQPGGPALLVGGASRTAALRAARFGDGFVVSGGRTDLLDLYAGERSRLGLPPGIVSGAPAPLAVHVAHDVERAWEQLGAHIAHDAWMYACWEAEGRRAPNPAPPTPSEVRERGWYAVVTPDECVQLWRDLDPRATLFLHPLVGGLDPDVGWASLELFEQSVLPAIRSAPTPRRS
jgi:alkanesulfonate monooxygenase SsuD/methylene tetrahydromethanopterin reductase-like flavin-dependent oxidoreductase (luciferase family)